MSKCRDGSSDMTGTAAAVLNTNPMPKPAAIPPAIDCHRRATQPVTAPVTMPFTVELTTIETIMGRASGYAQADSPSSRQRPAPSSTPTVGSSYSSSPGTVYGDRQYSVRSNVRFGRVCDEFDMPDLPTVCTLTTGRACVKNRYDRSTRTVPCRTRPSRSAARLATRVRRSPSRSLPGHRLTGNACSTGAQRYIRSPRGICWLADLKAAIARLGGAANSRD